MVAAWPLAAAQGALLLIPDLRQNLELGLLILVGAFAGLFLAWRRLAGRPIPWWASGRCHAALLGVATVLRLLALPLPPRLSDDVGRYLWDGRVLASGYSPWQFAPDALELLPLRDARWEQLPHRGVPGVYPPLASLLFAAAANSPRPLLTWKLMIVAVDLGACWLLLLLVLALGHPPDRALWYIWNPLLVLEGAGMGHLDVLGVGAAIGAALALTKGRSLGAGLTLAAGALVKFAPLVAVPIWALRSRRWVLLAGVAITTFGLGALPMFLSAGPIPAGLRTYGVSWEFNGPLFEPLWRLLDRLSLAAHLSGLLDHVKSWTAHRFDVALNDLYPLLYPQLLAKMVLGAAAVAVVARTWARARTVGLAESCHDLFGGLLLTSATVYPWYLLWVLPWAALAGRPAWLAASGLILFCYVPQHRPDASVAFWYCAEWLPFALLAFVSRWKRSSDERG